MHHQQRVVAEKGVKRLHMVAPEHGESVTIVTCALGIPIPPMTIFKGKLRKPAYGDDLPVPSFFEMSEKGNMKWM